MPGGINLRRCKTGDLKYIDQNKDNFINDDDRYLLKTFHSEWNYGLLLGCDVYNFDFNIALTGIANRSIFVTNNVLRGMQNNNKVTATVYDTWQQGVNNPQHCTRA